MKRSVKKLGILALFTLWACTASAEEINFYCKGVTKGRTIADSPSEFNMIVRTNPPEILLPPYINGNIGLSAEKEKQMKGGCEINETAINCSITGGGYILYSNYSLSRLSGVLKTHYVYAKHPSEKDANNGRFDCKRIEKKVF